MPSGTAEGGGSTSQGKGGQGAGKSQSSGGNGGGTAGNGKGPCKFYAGKGGCKMGRNCWSYHDFGKASVEGRCFNCGALDHRAEACTRPQARRTGKGEEGTPRGESAGSSNNNAGPSNNGGKGGNGGNQKGNGGKVDGKASQVRQVTAEEAAASTPASNAAGGDPKVAKAESSSQELIAEATKLLKGFRIAAARVVDGTNQTEPLDSSSPQPSDSAEASEVTTVEPEPFYLTKVVKEPLKGVRGLLDGGATNALRTAKSQAELNGCAKTQVALALGHAELFLTQLGRCCQRTLWPP